MSKLAEPVLVDRRHRLLEAHAPRPGISGTAYDTAWLASVPHPHDRRTSRFPTSLRWLTENQLTDGSWGSLVNHAQDRVLCTLAALTPLAQFGRRSADRDAVAAGTQYLWQHAESVRTDSADLVGFELLLPTLTRRAREAGVALPPALDSLSNQRARKLSQQPDALYSPRASVVRSLEFLGHAASHTGLRAAQGANGAIGNSPAATAFYLAGSNDSRALEYLNGCLDRTGGATAPVLHPCETFGLLGAAYHLHLGGIPTRRLLTPTERAYLRSALATGGVSPSPSFPMPDADNTALALLLLHAQGDPVDAGVLRTFARPEGHFASSAEPHALKQSGVGLNLHVLHALSRMPGYPDVERTVGRVVAYLAQHHSGEYWMDRWHVSPYYATAHAICIFDDLSAHQTRPVAHLVEKSRDWIRKTQNPNGSWGFSGQPTSEETAYGLLALTSGRVLDEADRARCAAANAYLREVGDSELPPLWVDKCLYTPPLVVRAAIEAARTVYLRRCAA